ncbi:hypothetical protein [Streptomyces sp. C]|uniref:hypothetical protein n=1 Tax=Streptomyces sp. C TaxID=253839 RepID=UPI0001B56281|nr:hypothetical protein [Streptomyces sp. C]EFL16835.1 predicted protein [Streptomyces sp. C]
MSAREERTTLTPGTALYDYALFRRGTDPDGGIPRRGYPVPDGAERPDGPAGPPPSRPRLTWERAREEVTAALAGPLADPDPVRATAAVHHAVGPLRLPDRTVLAVAARMPLDDESAARATARRLTRTGTTLTAVGVGVALLTRLGEPEDVPCLKALGLLRGLGRPAAAALDPLDRQAAALLHLTHLGRDGTLTPLINAATATAPATAPDSDSDSDSDSDDRAARPVRDALVALVTAPDWATAIRWHSRRIAEAARLDALLRAHPDDTALTTAAGRLLHAMASQYNARADLLDYGPAAEVYRTVAARAGLPDPDLDHQALLLSLAQDLHSGTGALLDRPAGEREALLALLERHLGSEPPPGPHDRRAAWLARNRTRPFDHPAPPAPPTPLRIEVVTGDPAIPTPVETRILIDGRPLVPALFDKGPAHPPEHLLDGDVLLPGPEPREVQLAEADCTEGCCGALYVTVRREGDEVVWDGWRGAAGPPPPELRFDAAAYEAEVRRARADESWAWPARRTARRITAALRARPELRTRWELRWIRAATDWRDPDLVTVNFGHRPAPATPPGPGEDPAPSLTFEWQLPDDGRPPEAQAEAAVARLETADPKTYARLTGGNRELAESLGYTWPRRNRKNQEE